jgi:ferredoxin-like protein FixX
MSCESCMACMACRVAAHGKKLNRSKVMGVNVAETW